MFASLSAHFRRLSPRVPFTQLVLMEKEESPCEASLETCSTSRRQSFPTNVGRLPLTGQGDFDFRYGLVDISMTVGQQSKQAF